jgi:putative ABC transport system permease protein
LRDGVTMQEAEQELDAVQAGYVRRVLGGRTELHASIVPLQQQVTSRARDGLRLAMAAVLAVLLIAYTNVANLLLARSSARSREFAVRAALGASRWHLARQTLLEALLLAAGGSVVGIALAPTRESGSSPSTLPRRCPIAKASQSTFEYCSSPSQQRCFQDS